MGTLQVVGFLLWQLGRWIFWSGRVAWHVFSPRVGIHPTLAWVAWARTLIGLVVTFAVVTRYDAVNVDAFGNAVVKAGLVSIGATPVLLGAMIFLVVRARTGRDELLRRLARGPGLAWVIWTGAVLGFFFGLQHLNTNNDLVQIALFLIAIWVLIFAAAGALQVYRFVFNASDGHPLLPALTVPAFALVATLYEILIDLDPDVPKTVAVTISALGTVCAFALSWWEFTFVSRTYGITTRIGAPNIDCDTATGQLTWKTPPTPAATP